MTEADLFLAAGAGPWNRSFVQLSEDEDKCQDNYAYQISENNHHMALLATWERQHSNILFWNEKNTLQHVLRNIFLIIPHDIFVMVYIIKENL